MTFNNKFGEMGEMVYKQRISGKGRVTIPFKITRRIGTSNDMLCRKSSIDTRKVRKVR